VAAAKPVNAVAPKPKAKADRLIEPAPAKKTEGENGDDNQQQEQSPADPQVAVGPAA